MASFKDNFGLEVAIRFEGASFDTAFFGFPLESLAEPDREEVLGVLTDWMNPLTGPDLQFVAYEALSPLSPGSTVPLTVTLGNAGNAALGVSATLVSFDPLVTVTDPAAPIPPSAAVRCRSTTLRLSK